MKIMPSSTATAAGVLLGLGTLATAASFSVFAQGATDPRCADSPECGWWYNFYNQPVEPREPQAPSPQEQAQAEEQEPTEEERCANQDTWTFDCGFIDPNQAYPEDRMAAYDFQSKQRDALLNEMAMNPNNREGVEQMQYYTRWVVNQATNAARMWQFNSVQNPELNAALDYPVSSYGLRLVEAEEDNFHDSVFSTLKDGDATLIWFTRADCRWCHSMLDTMVRLAVDTGIDFSEASLSDTCLTADPEVVAAIGYEPECLTSDLTALPGSLLSVTTVPDLLLYLPDDDTFLRISTGVTSLNTMKARVVNFMGAVRAAQVNAISNGRDGSPSVDFSDRQDPNGLGLGVPNGNS